MSNFQWELDDLIASDEVYYRELDRRGDEADADNFDDNRDADAGDGGPF